MSQTAVAHPPLAVVAAPVAAEPAGAHPAIIVQVAADNALAARLIHARAEVAAALRVAIEKGADIRARRIRYQEDLDEARLVKLKWTQAITDLLTALFDGTAVADYCNDWVGKIFPEYAEFGNFVEQFYEEMEYRLAKLRSVLGRVEQADDAPALPMTVPPPPAAPAAPRIAAFETMQPPVHPAVVQPAVTAQPPVVVQPAATVQSSVTAQSGMTIQPAMQPEATRPVPVRPVPMSHVMLFGAAASDPAHAAVSALLDQLDIGAHPTPDPLTAGPTDAAVFIVPSRMSDTATSRLALFQLGCAVGRLGASRVFVLHAAGSPPCPESQVVHIPADPNGAWQLQLARQLKQAGLNLDLNKLC
ncbi:MAG TPA: hypothetical protein VGR35_14330 [Tepidisphaeraceae bacterium]|nr:hypothetical protein [Tepidisphaeraceae bacterium]